MSFSEAILENNKGVACLNSNDFWNAIDCFSISLKLQKAHDVANTNHNLDNQDECLVDQCMLLRDTNEDDEESPAHTFVYDQGIMLLPSVQDPAVVASIAIFNLALAYHLMATRNHDGVCSELLQKACRLYQVAHKVQNMTDNALFQFAILNNIAVIYREIGNESVANNCIDYLMPVFMMFVDRGRFEELRHVRGFLVNVPCTLVTAAAA